MVSTLGLCSHLHWRQTSCLRLTVVRFPRSPWYVLPIPWLTSVDVTLATQYIITNLGISHNFARIEFDRLIYPATMSIDWIRVYQPKDAINIGCDPIDFPTAQYIETCVFLPCRISFSRSDLWLCSYKEAYTNANLTTWESTGQLWPKNRLIPGNCDDEVRN